MKKMVMLDINYVHVHFQKANNIPHSMNNLHFLHSSYPLLAAMSKCTQHNEITNY
jgi:hypothetical protein